MSNPICGKCGKVMTPENARIYPEYFLHDACLPEEIKATVTPKRNQCPHRDDLPPAYHWREACFLQIGDRAIADDGKCIGCRLLKGVISPSIQRFREMTPFTPPRAIQGTEDLMGTFLYDTGSQSTTLDFPSNPYRQVIDRLRGEKWSQRQDSTLDQLKDVLPIVYALGCYDAGGFMQKFLAMKEKDGVISD